MDLTEESLEKAIKEIKKFQKDRNTTIAIKPTKVLIFPQDLKKDNTKMYKIYRDDRRYNNKTFSTYEEARKYVRRKVTEIFGEYVDDYTWLGFRISK